jgi:hypothetical protein
MSGVVVPDRRKALLLLAGSRWLIDTVDRLTRWLERMPAHTYPEDSRLWKSWALTSPVLPMIRARAAARGGDAA